MVDSSSVCCDSGSSHTACTSKIFLNLGMRDLSQPKLSTSRSTPALGGQRATTNLGRRLMLSQTELSHSMAFDESQPSTPPFSPLSCARRLREQMFGESSKQTLRDSKSQGCNQQNRTTESKEHTTEFGCGLASSDDALSAIQARMRDRGENHHASIWVSTTPRSVLDQRREHEKQKRMRQAHLSKITNRMANVRERGELLPSEIPYDDRLEQVMARKVQRETESMLQKVTRARNSYHDVNSRAGAAEALCKSVVMDDYVFC